MSRIISLAEVNKHNKKKDLWIVVHGKVYDLTKFAPEHPGGSHILFNLAGKDGTRIFDTIHTMDIFDKYADVAPCIGELDPKDAPAKSDNEVVPKGEKPPLDFLLNAFEFEQVAKNCLTPPAWAYISSGSDDEVTLRENHSAFGRIWLRPRVMVNVRDIDMSTTILGYPCAFPVMIAPTALAKLAHPDGEKCYCRGAGNMDIIQVVPTLGSLTVEEITAVKKPGQTHFMQLYVNTDRKKTASLVKRAEKCGCKALFVTVDAPQMGRREKDMRMKYVPQATNQEDEEQEGNRGGGTANYLSSFIDPALAWSDIPSLNALSKMDIVIKGIQCAEDAVLAYKHGAKAIVVSNHGGRQLDYSRSAIETLPEVMEALKKIGADKKMEVYIDGGVRRGTDIFKAIALGAKAVLVGRPVIYGAAGYGTDGVTKVLQLLKDEFRTAMMLCGTTKVDEIDSTMVSTKSLHHHYVTSPNPDMFNYGYVPFAKL
mmetsp:Transcript_20136/g.28089  ORF Transcript_20136/g.28089 Transcript_20136/m.28089 type:complete len:483 (-) Transcript_20136:424-1872(-)|eukprot:CAMPEP_0184478214 /NCGR_PEP_ID=MMETSP0113_2-20130426/297_1 /TAXON_ID=91329 /ORGANISM="Norrisiella sphaerica, Strain BC52" /LENGTH=482 /DNA_ID=CAMNT_0026855919 /DNA_START=155 /DNA_END=1603 /DNA_ORIENTATION=-